MDDSGEIVLPAFPESLPSPPSADRRLTRLDLANWLTDVDDGMGLFTARVMVNRLWAMCFGSGLSASLDDWRAGRGSCSSGTSGQTGS
ncbi:MAG: DUF1553 domain-containing protein [Planctomycetaceae bacterium]